LCPTYSLFPTIIHTARQQREFIMLYASHCYVMLLSHIRKTWCACHQKQIYIWPAWRATLAIIFASSSDHARRTHAGKCCNAAIQRSKMIAAVECSQLVLHTQFRFIFNISILCQSKIVNLNPIHVWLIRLTLSDMNSWPIVTASSWCVISNLDTVSMQKFSFVIVIISLHNDVGLWS